MKIKRILKSREFAQKAGWALLISVLLGILVMMVIVISKTEPNIQKPEQPTDQSDSALLEELTEALDSTEIATLESKREVEEYAIASRTVDGENVEIEVALESNPPENGTTYVGWLVGDDKTETISLGVLNEDSSQQRLYVLNYSDNRNLEDYDLVQITQESRLSNSKNKQGNVILEGRFN